MKTFRSLFIIGFLVTIAVGATPAAPTLSTEGYGIVEPAEGESGQANVFKVCYTDKADEPQEVKMVLNGPAGVSTVPPTTTTGSDPAQGIVETFSFVPKNVGTYKYHFEATSKTGETAQPTPDEQFTSYSITTQYLFLAVGCLIGLFGVPLLVYVITRSVNKRGNPATAARFGLLLGVLACYALFLYLFHSIYSPLNFVVAGVAALAVLVALFARR